MLSLLKVACQRNLFSAITVSILNFLALQEFPTDQYFVAIQACPSVLHFCDFDDVIVNFVVLAFATFSVLLKQFYVA